jgi:hypothetical protein
MSKKGSQSDVRLGDMAAMARLIQRLPNGTGASVDGKRRLVADLCRLVGERVTGSGGGATVGRSAGGTVP